jgi:Cu(I)/Ag(I) efflux system membrane fusion protein
MKRTIFLTVATTVVLALGFALGQWWSAGSDMAGVSGTGEREVLYYKAPMDPNYRSDTPGTSPMGMDLVPVYADEVAGSDPGVVSIDPKIVNNLGVRTAAVGEGVLSRRIETVGYIGYDEDTLHQINTRVDGWIEKLTIKSTGDPVKRGQTLFELYSPTLVNAQQEYLAALKSRNTALHQASRERLAALGVTATEIKRLDSERTVKQRIRVYAQSDGVVAHLGVREGIYITPATEVMSIADLDRVWVLAEVFERQAAWVKAGQRAEFELDYVPGERWRGTVDYVYPELDPKTRTLKVRLRFDNPGDVLRPNMFARVTIHSTETPSVVHVPQEALIRGGAVDRVVLALGEGRFRAQPVEVGMESGDRIEIRSGLSAGDRVVTSGQFLIDSESNIETALARMDESSSDESPASVTVAAVVRGIDVAETTVRLEHEAISAWSWPAMTMRFDVAEQSLLEGLDEGTSVQATIEKHGDDRFVVTAIASGSTTDHSQHNMESEQ